MNLSNELRRLAIGRVFECYQQAEATLGRTFPLADVSFKQRGKIAGSARLEANQIRLNPVLFADNFGLFVSEVIPHEVCHLIAFQLYGRVQPHGLEWQSLMRDLFGLDGKTRHQMDVSKVQGQTFKYQCQCGPVSLSVRRHRNVQRGKHNYVCRVCNTALMAVQA